MRKHFLLLALVLPTLSASCSLTKSKETEPATESNKKPAKPKLVGRIASIPADRRFVLIQSYGKWEVGTGKILTTRGSDGRTANLLATGENMGQYAAADLQAGEVEIGDAVFDRAEIEVTTPSPTPADKLPEDKPVAEPIIEPENNI